MMSPAKYNIGDIVEVFDKIDPENQDTIIATVRMIEPDDELPMNWIYLVANEEVLNTSLDARIGQYWTIFEENSIFVQLLHRATVQ